MNKLKWIAVVVLALAVGLILATVSIALSLLAGSWIPLWVAGLLAMGVIGFALNADRWYS